jgi:hypothetical protein
VIRLSDGNVKPGVHLVLFDKNRLMLDSGFPFKLCHLTIITHTVHHNTILTNTLILDIFLYLQDLIRHVVHRKIEDRE